MPSCWVFLGCSGLRFYILCCGYDLNSLLTLAFSVKGEGIRTKGLKSKLTDFLSLAKTRLFLSFDRDSLRLKSHSNEVRLSLVLVFELAKDLLMKKLDSCGLLMLLKLLFEFFL